MPSEKTPPDIEQALVADPAAKAAFEGLPPSHRREYLLWVSEAKRPETRARRIAGMIDRLKPAGTNGHDG
jgi:uncharacterized protein YdeI (YjbR/CyaY-like superfamily)